MRNFIRTTLLSSALLFMTSLVGIPATAQVSVGIRIFAPPEPLSLSFPRNLDPTLSGLAATGIPLQATIAGMKAIGAGHSMKVLVGSALATMESASITAIGTALTATSNMTINGITIMNAITAAITITTTMITVTAMITMTTTKIAWVLA